MKPLPATKKWGSGDGYYQDVDSSYNIEDSWKSISKKHFPNYVGSFCDRFRISLDKLFVLLGDMQTYLITRHMYMKSVCIREKWTKYTFESYITQSG